MSKKQPVTFSPASNGLGFVLWHATNLWQREIKLALAEFDITHAQFLLLSCIYTLQKDKQIVTQITLSTHTKIDPMTTSTVLRTLQAKDLIDRQEHESDSRSKTVVLTPEGLEVIKKASKTVDKFDKKFFKTFGKYTEEFQAKLEELLEA
jgi:DNA-binding MarR family transcriptional regulator